MSKVRVYLFLISLLVAMFNLSNVWAAKQQDGISITPFKPVNILRDNSIYKYDGGGTLFSSPTAENDQLYFGTSDGDLYAFDPDLGFGKLIVEKPEIAIYYPPVLWNNIFCFGDGKYLYGFDYVKGKQLWKTQIGYESDFPTISNNGIVIVGDYNLHGVDIKTGEKLWKMKLDTWTYNQYVFSDDCLFFADWNGVIYAVDDITGRVKWKTAKTGLKYELALINGEIYAGGSDGSLLVLDGKTGRLNWKAVINDKVKYPPVLAGNMIFVVGEYRDRMYAIDQNSKLDNWRFRYTGKVVKAPVISNDIIIYVTYYNNSQHIQATDVKTGVTLWTFDCPRSIRSNLKVVGNSVYFTTWNGYIYALDVKTGQQKWSFTAI